MIYKRIKCHNPKCLNEWKYKGDSKFYATCPKCLHKVNIHKILKGGNNGKRNSNKKY